VRIRNGANYSKSASKYKVQTGLPRPEEFFRKFGGDP